MATDLRRGSVLILALWSFSLLTVFAVSLGYLVRQKVSLSNRLEKRATLWNAAWSGVESARAVIKADTDAEIDSYSEDWGHDTPGFRDVVFPEAVLSVGHERWAAGKKTFRYALSDEQSKLNLNFAEPQELAMLLQQVAGLEPEEGQALAFAIVDWRDGDSAFGHPDYGAEDSEYDSLPLPYEAKDSPYEALDELLLVKGMNRDIFEKIKPFVTVFGPGTVNLNTAGKEALAALGLPAAVVDKVLRHRDGFDGVPGTGDDRAFLDISGVVNDVDREEPPLSDVERIALENLVGSGKVVLNSEVFGLTSRARTPDGRAELVIEAVLKRDATILFCRTAGFRWLSR